MSARLSVWEFDYLRNFMNIFVILLKCNENELKDDKKINTSSLRIKF